MFSNMIQDSIEKFISNLVEGCIEIFLQVLNGMNSMTVTVLDMPIVNSSILYSQALAGSILAVKFSYELWYNNVLRSNGDSDADVQGVIMRLGQAAAMMISVPWITKEVYMWGTAIASDIALLPGTDANSGGLLLKTLFMTMLTGSGPVGMLIGVTIVFAIVVFLLILVQTFIRAAELAVVAIVGAFMALGLTNPNSQSFQGWWKELLNISFAQVIQLVLIKCSFFALAIPQGDGYPPIVSVMVFAGFIWVTYKSPTILKQYIHSSGVGRAAGQVAQQAGSNASMLVMRKLMKV